MATGTASGVEAQSSVGREVTGERLNDSPCSASTGEHQGAHDVDKKLSYEQQDGAASASVGTGRSRTTPHGGNQQ